MLEGGVPVHQIRPEGDHPRPLQVVGDGAAHGGVLHHVAVGGQEDLQPLLFQKLLLLLRPLPVVARLRLFRQTVGPLYRLRGPAQGLAQLQEGVLLGPAAHLLVDLVGEEPLVRAAEHIAHQVGGGLEAGAHTAVAAVIAHPGHQDEVAFAHQGGHVAQVDFQGEAGLVDGQGRAPLLDGPVGGGAGDGFDAQLLEEGPPEDAAAGVEQGPGEADFQGYIFHRSSPRCQLV